MYAKNLLMRVLRWTGWVTWVAVGLPVAVQLGRSPADKPEYSLAVWFAAYFLFAPAFAIAGSYSSRPIWSSLHVPSLVIATITPLIMIGISPECFAGAMLVIVAWQVSMQLSTMVALTWVGIQSLILSAVVVVNYPNSIGISDSIIFTVFQFFAFCTAYVTKKELDAQQELRTINAYLKTTRLLLSQSSRIAERVRISRDLHDVLGHDLTALALHLEIAKNTHDAQRDVDKAQTLAKGLLAKVRQVVSLMRADDYVDVVPILKELAANEPKLRIHIEADDSASELDTERAYTLLRCLQEAITNARVHSGATNLWLDIRQQDGAIVAQAKDDGQGAITTSSDGYGLQGMNERLKEYGGRMAMDSVPGRGFTLVLTLPLKPI